MYFFGGVLEAGGVYDREEDEEDLCILVAGLNEVAVRLVASGVPSSQ